MLDDRDINSSNDGRYHPYIISDLMDNADLIEKYEHELSCLISRMRADEIREEVIRFMLGQAEKDSEMKIIAKGELD